MTSSAHYRHVYLCACRWNCCCGVSIVDNMAVSSYVWRGGERPPAFSLDQSRRNRDYVVDYRLAAQFLRAGSSGQRDSAGETEFLERIRTRTAPDCAGEICR